jgi:RNA polymerase sigma-70 factor (ECF subfamily)
MAQTPTQRELVLAAKAGDSYAFEQLLDAEMQFAYRAALAVLRSPDEAQDALQDAAVRAWVGLPGLRDPLAWRAWFRRIVVRASLDRAQNGRQRHEIPLTSECQMPATDLEPSSLGGVLRLL